MNDPARRARGWRGRAAAPTAERFSMNSRWFRDEGAIPPENVPVATEPGGFPPSHRLQPAFVLNPRPHGVPPWHGSRIACRNPWERATPPELGGISRLSGGRATTGSSYEAGQAIFAKLCLQLSCGARSRLRRWWAGSGRVTGRGCRGRAGMWLPARGSPRFRGLLRAFPSHSFKAFLVPASVCLPPASSGCLLNLKLLSARGPPGSVHHGFA